MAQVPGMPNDLLAMLRNQGTPRTVGGYTILVLIGADITIAGYDNAQAFLGDASRAGDLTCSILIRLGSLNAPIIMFSSEPFPLVNLYPWKDTVDTRDI